MAEIPRGPDERADAELVRTGDPHDPHRVIAMDRSVKCCRAAALRALHWVEEGLAELASARGGGEQIALVPGLTPTINRPGSGTRLRPQSPGLPKITRLPAGAPLALGVVILFDALFVDDWVKLRQREQIEEAGSRLIGTITEQIRTGDDSEGCRECLAAQAFKQKPDKRQRYRDVKGKLHRPRA